MLLVGTETGHSFKCLVVAQKREKSAPLPGKGTNFSRHLLSANGRNSSSARRYSDF
jgi:hypothetical protein